MLPDGAGMDLLGEEYSVAAYNILRNNARGLESGNTASTASPNVGCHYHHNIITANTAYGITIIADSVREQYTHNRVENNAQGVRMGTATANQSIEDLTFSFNEVHNNGSPGVDMFGAVYRASLEFNHMSGNTEDIQIRTSTFTPDAYALIDNRLRSTTTIDDQVNAANKILRLYGA